MKPNEALQILIKHQAWRKGEHDEATEPKDLTEAMNVAIEALEKEEKDKSNWERRNKEVDEALDKKFGAEDNINYHKNTFAISEMHNGEPIGATDYFIGGIKVSRLEWMRQNRINDLPTLIKELQEEYTRLTNTNLKTITK